MLTCQSEELVATKLRALVQRKKNKKKGRDLFDLWPALTVHLLRRRLSRSGSLDRVVGGERQG